MHHLCCLCCDQGTAAMPVTFPTLESHLEFTATSGTGIQAQMEFRTHDEDGLLIYHPMSQENSGLTVSALPESFQSQALPIHLPFISPNLVFSKDSLFRLALVLLFLSG